MKVLDIRGNEFTIDVEALYQMSIHEISVALHTLYTVAYENGFKDAIEDADLVETYIEDERFKNLWKSLENS